MSHKAIPDSTDEYCGTSYAAKLLNLSVGSIQSLVEKNELIAWKTQGGHRRISIQSIHDYQSRANLSPKVQTPQGKYLKVMVVEDDANSRAMYQAHFDSWDLPIDAVIQVSAIEALLDIPVVKPQVLLADLRMPGIDGVEMLRQLSAHPQFTKMSVIVITGLSNEEIAAYGELPAGTHVLRKPVDMGWLKGYFQAMLSLRTPSKRSAMPIETE
ncbi:MAG: response regulator [Limnohabitans sp.]|jgi:excisionase family DNA binding protein|nr:response regulator [Burkholderiaceae bacterium]